MASQNLTALLDASRAASSAASAAGRARFLEILDPEIVWVAHEGPPDLRGEFHGVNGARRYYAAWASAWEEWDWRIEETREDGDVIVTRTWVTGRGRGSGLDLDMRVGQVWTFRDGLVVRYEAFSSFEDALGAAGMDGQGSTMRSTDRRRGGGGTDVDG